jgi:hypothetical protein
LPQFFPVMDRLEVRRANGFAVALIAAFAADGRDTFVSGGSVAVTTPGKVSSWCIMVHSGVL